MSSNINNYPTLNSEHKWEDLCIQLKNQQTYTLDYHVLDHGRFEHCRFANATQVLLYIFFY